MMPTARDFAPGQRVVISRKGSLWVSSNQGVVEAIDLENNYVNVKIGSKVHAFWPGYLSHEGA